MASKPSPFASIINKHRPALASYEDLYKHCHANGELSTQERETAALVTSHLKKLPGGGDLDIRPNIGGHGQIAILRNGEGKTLLLRADIDALPVQEKTGLPYASTKTMTDTDGQVKPVMHACGHDFHVSLSLLVLEGSWFLTHDRSRQCSLPRRHYWRVEATGPAPSSSSSSLPRKEAAGRVP